MRRRSVSAPESERPTGEYSTGCAPRHRDAPTGGMQARHGEAIGRAFPGPIVAT